MVAGLEAEGALEARDNALVDSVAAEAADVGDGALQGLEEGRAVGLALWYRCNEWGRNRDKEELRLTDVGTCGVSLLESALLKRLVYSWVEKAAAKSWLLINSCDG